MLKKIEKQTYSISLSPLCSCFLRKLNHNILSNSLKTAYTIDLRRCLVISKNLFTNLRYSFDKLKILFDCYHYTIFVPPRKTFLFQNKFPLNGLATGTFKVILFTHIKKHRYSNGAFRSIHFFKAHIAPLTKDVFLILHERIFSVYLKSGVNGGNSITAAFFS